MKTVAVAVISAAAGFIIGTLGYQNTSHNATETQVEYRTIVQQIATTIDIDRLRDTEAASPHQDDNDYECTIALQRLTDEPWMGIILYLEDHWSGDACAAYEHQVLHGWY